VLPTSDSREARRAAARILAERRFQTERAPQPLKGVLTWLGDRLRVLGRPFGWLIRQLNRLLPGGGNVVWLALLLIGLGLLCVLIYRRVAFRSRRPVADDSSPGGRETAAELDRLAMDAERNSDYALSVRLRFRAGLRRLAEQHVLRGPEQRPNSELSAHLDDPAFVSLATRFDQIAYGVVGSIGSAPGVAPATPADVSDANQRWPAVIARGVELARRRRSGAPVSAEEKKRRWWTRMFRFVARRDRTTPR
jgi:hypothetical protein